MAHRFQRMMGERYKAAVEELTGVKVLAFLSQAHVDPDITLEVFVLERPVAGYGATEVVEGERVD